MWLAEQKSTGLVDQTHITAWQTYFSQLPVVPTAAFPFFLPDAVDAKSTAAASKPITGLSTVLPPAPNTELQALAEKVVRQQQGPAVEPVTHPLFTKKQKKAQLQAVQTTADLQFYIKVGYFAFLNCVIYDPEYTLRLGFCKLTHVHENHVQFGWWTYRGYPHSKPENHKGPWQKQIRQGKGQIQDRGSCPKSQIVYSFPASGLTRGKKISAKCLKVVDALLLQGLPEPEPGIPISLFDVCECCFSNYFKYGSIHVSARRLHSCVYVS